MSSTRPTLRLACILPLPLIALAGCADLTAPHSGTSATNVQFTSTSSVTALVAAGDGRTCALRSPGFIECWGVAFDPVSANPITPGTATFTQLGVGVHHACALRADGAVECWGSDAFGQAPALRTAASGVYVQLAVGFTHNCALRDDGVVECWGVFFEEHGTPFAVQASATAASGVFVQVSAAIRHDCALRDDGVVECWGQDLHGQAPATKSASSGEFVEVGSGTRASCGLRDDGVVECWGDNEFGGAPATVVAGSGTFTQLTLGFEHGCALRNDGAAQCWGPNSAGEAPALVSATTGTFTQIDGGKLHSCGQRSDGSVQCWGDNTDGQLDEPAGAPAAPSALNAVAISATRIDLDWTDESWNESGFKVERRTRNGSVWDSWQDVTTTPADETSYSDESVAGGTKYQYRLRACNAHGCSATVFSSAVTTPATLPAAPTAVTAALAGADVQVTWTDASTNESEFRVQRRVHDGTVWSGWATVATLGANTAAFLDDETVEGRKHQYRVRACNSAGCSAQVASKSVLVPLAPPAAPADLQRALNAGSVDLTWTDLSTNETRFEIFRRVRVGGVYEAWQLLLPIGADEVAFTDATVLEGQTYQYRVRACRDSACSSYAVSSAINVPVSVPAAPTNIVANWLHVALIEVTWTDNSSNETSYEIQRRLNDGTGYTAWQTLATPAANTTSYQDSDPDVPGVRHQYRARACNTAGCSGWTVSTAIK